jgi:hypothetical protein
VDRRVCRTRIWPGPHWSQAPFQSVCSVSRTLFCPSTVRRRCSLIWFSACRRCISSPGTFAVLPRDCKVQWCCAIQLAQPVAHAVDAGSSMRAFSEPLPGARIISCFSTIPMLACAEPLPRAPGPGGAVPAFLAVPGAVEDAQARHRPGHAEESQVAVCQDLGFFWSVCRFPPPPSPQSITSQARSAVIVSIIVSICLSICLPLMYHGQWVGNFSDGSKREVFTLLPPVGLSPPPSSCPRHTSIANRSFNFPCTRHRVTA